MPRLVNGSLLAALGITLLTTQACDRTPTNVERDVPYTGDLRLVATLGAADGPGALHQVRSVVDTYDGSLWVFEWDGEIARFSPAGAYVGRVSRKGSGPGELPQISSGHVDPYSGRVSLSYIGTTVLTDSAFVEVARFESPMVLPVAGSRRVIEPGQTAIWSLEPLRADTVQGPGSRVAAVEGVFALVRRTPGNEDTLGTVFGEPRLYPVNGGSAFHPLAGHAVLRPADSLGVLVTSGHREYDVTLYSYTSREPTYVYRRRARQAEISEGARTDAAKRISRISGDDIGIQHLPPLSAGYVQGASFDRVAVAYSSAALLMSQERVCPSMSSPLKESTVEPQCCLLVRCTWIDKVAFCYFGWMT